jgi:hypothetical protein
MNFVRLAFVALLLTPTLGACSPQMVAETVSKAQVCSAASEILADMEELLVSSVANPLAIDTYFGKISELSEEFASLTPLPKELSDAHKAVSMNFEQLLEISDEPTLSNLVVLPNLIADTQVSLIDFKKACSL